MIRASLVAGLVAALLALHQLDPLGLRTAAAEPRLFLGLPLALAYHLGYCLLAAGALALALRWAWPTALLRTAEASVPRPAGEGPAAPATGAARSLGQPGS
jgi:hypothetical protein